ncbi:MAG: Mu-like prophage major head subunit gpT family protein [Methylococcales bacterium]
MLVNRSNLGQLFEGFNTSFNKGLDSADSHYQEISMIMPSKASEETYGWLGQFPKLKEWIGDRTIKNLVAHSYTVKNKVYEDTISVKRTDIEDDQYGLMGPLVSEMGRVSGEHPDELIFSLLAAGFATKCYDGQFFFDTDHPVGVNNPVSVSNMQAGAGPGWFLLDTSRSIKPVLFQERIPYKFTSLTNDQDENVFMRDEYLYGIRARVNVGFGLWQLAFGSKDTLDATNYEAARVAMMSQEGDEGRKLGIRPDTLVVAPSLESEALTLIQNELIINSGVAVSNQWAGTAKLIVAPWLE